MENPNGILKIYRRLDRIYPEARIKLIYRSPWQLLVATILSAQCTDDRVNRITPPLFSDYPDISDYLKMKPAVLIKYIRSAGFFNNKAKNILGAAKKITAEFAGKIPDNMEELLTVPGVARKTANVVLGNAYNVVEGIAVDTHVKRLSFRLGLSGNTVPEKIEADLMRSLAKRYWFRLTYLLIEHGRKTCKAVNPDCKGCPIKSLCPKTGTTEARKNGDTEK